MPTIAPTIEPIAPPTAEPAAAPAAEPIAAPTAEPATAPTFAPTAAPSEPPETLEITGGVTVIGDSVALGAAPTLTKSIPDCVVDAQVSRQISRGHDVMTGMQAKGALREYVVIALGTNGHGNYANLLTQIIDDLEQGHKLIFVTPYDGRSNENAAIVKKTAVWIRELPDQYDFITVADWAALIAPQNNMLAGDKVHMGGQKSLALYAYCVIEAIARASDGGEK